MSIEENVSPQEVDSESRLRVFSTHPLFSRLTPIEISELAQLAEEVRFQPEEAIVLEGDFIDSFYFIMRGC